MIIHILDPNTDEIVGWITDVITDSHTQDLQGTEHYDFEGSVFSNGYDKIQNRSRLIIPSEDGDYREMVVWQYEDFTESLSREVTSHGSIKDIGRLKKIQKQYREGETVESAARYVLEGLPWQLGTVEYSGISNWRISKSIDAYEALQSIASLFDCELVSRIAIEGYEITGRFVDFVKRQGQNRGNEIVFGKDMKGINRKVADRVATSLRVFGPERDDGTRITTTVVNDSAYQEWNWNGYHIIDDFEPDVEDKDISEEELKTLGEQELNRRISEAVEWEISAEAPEHIKGFFHEKRRLGDTVRVKDEYFQPPIYLDSRITSVSRSIFDETKKTFKLGEVIEYKKEDIFATWEELQNQFGLKKIRSEAPPIGSSNVIWVKPAQISGQPDISHDWNSDIKQWVKTTPNQAGEVGSYTQSEVDEKDTSAFQAGANYTDQRFTNDPVLGSVEVDTSGQVSAKSGKVIISQRIRGKKPTGEYSDEYIDMIDTDLVAVTPRYTRTLLGARDTVAVIYDGNQMNGTLFPEAYGKTLYYSTELYIPNGTHALGDIYTFKIDIPDYTSVAIARVLSIRADTESARFDANVKMNSRVTDGIDLMSFEVELKPNDPREGAYTVPITFTITGTR